MLDHSKIIITIMSSSILLQFPKKKVKESTASETLQLEKPRKRSVSDQSRVHFSDNKKIMLVLLDTFPEMGLIMVSNENT